MISGNSFCLKIHDKQEKKKKYFSASSAQKVILNWWSVSRNPTLWSVTLITEKPFISDSSQVCKTIFLQKIYMHWASTLQTFPKRKISMERWASQLQNWASGKYSLTALLSCCWESGSITQEGCRPWFSKLCLLPHSAHYSWVCNRPQCPAGSCLTCILPGPSCAFFCKSAF